MTANVQCLWVIALTLSAVPCAGQTDPDTQVDLTANGWAPQPVNGATAAATIFSRQRAVVTNLACGTEISFLSNTIGVGQQIRNSSSGGAVNLSLAKMYWLYGFPTASGQPRASSDGVPCKQQVLLRHLNNPADGEMLPPSGLDPSSAAPGQFVDYVADLNAMAALGSNNLAGVGLNAEFQKVYGDACSQVITAVKTTPFPGGTNYTVTSSVSIGCLLREVDTALSKVFVTGHMGSDGTPCDLISTIKSGDGNWDFAMRSLIRVLYLDNLYRVTYQAHAGILPQDLNARISNTLITTGIKLGPPGYPITGCGNTENDTGSPDDRVDNPGFFDQVGQDLGGLFNWFLNHLYLFAPEELVAAAGVDPLISAVLSTLGGLVQNANIPETENHRLMIESTRYLKNELIRQQLVNEGDSDRLKILASAQQDVHGWLLQRLQSLLTDDFSEYNARPYQRESIGAIMNLYDFAPDADIHNGALLVLEYAFTRFAVGSNQGRRLVPFRRHMEDVSEFIETNTRVLYTAAEADHQEALGLLYTGQTQQLPLQTVVPYAGMNAAAGPNGPAPTSNRFAPTVLTGEAAFGAFSWYQPSELVLDIAINKTTPYFQRFRHAGIEAYSSGAGFLLSAGGLVTGYASNVDGFGDANDRGAAVPTVLMLASNTDKERLWDFVLIRGLRERISGALNGPQYTYDYNTCLTRGFACGLNLYVPADVEACLTHPPTREAYWSFFDSKTCGDYGSGPAVYAVIYRKPCLLATANCDTFGFIEAIDVASDSPAAFQQFQTATLARNAASLIADPPSVIAGGGGGGLTSQTSHLKSTYFAADGRKIDFDPTGMIIDPLQTGIIAVNGTADSSIDQWPGASGALVNKAITSQSGTAVGSLVTITNPNDAYKGKALRLDFTNLFAPAYVYP